MEFIKSTDIHQKIYEMLGSEDYLKMLSNTCGADNKDFRAGAMFGSAMSAIYITTHAEKFHLDIRCNCANCAFHNDGHPEKPWLPCKETQDDDFCSYAIPKNLISEIVKEGD